MGGKKLKVMLTYTWIFVLIHSSLVLSLNVTREEIMSHLKNVLVDYDSKAFPSRNGEPINVSLQLHIVDLVPTKQKNMHFTVTMYFRQFWSDYRLAIHKHHADELASPHINGSGLITLSWEFSQMIWTPDIFFLNAIEGKRIDVVSPNVLVRIGVDGAVFFSQHFRITSFCQMNLKFYPFDRQQCTLPMESYAYSIDNVRLFWNKALDGPIFGPEETEMVDYTFDSYEYKKNVMRYGSKMKYDKLTVTFHFKRNIVSFLLKMYIPCMLIVMLSWISFWIDYRSTPARVSLGITSVLTMATLGNSIRTSVPPVSYVKAIDIYVILCFFYVFSALIEYALVGVTDISLRKFIKEENLKDEELSNCSNDLNSSISSRTSQFESILKNSSDNPSIRPRMVKKRTGVTLAPDTTVLEETHRRATKLRNKGTFAKKIMKEQRKNDEIHYIDRVCRFMFPFTFFVSNVVYFTVCMMN